MDWAKPFLARLTKETAARLASYKQTQRISKAAIIEIALVEYLDRNAPLDERLEKVKAT